MITFLMSWNYNCGHYFYSSYPRIVEGDPVFDSIAKSLKAQVGKIVEEVDHTCILPTSIFLLQNL